MFFFLEGAPAFSGFGGAYTGSGRDDDGRQGNIQQRDVSFFQRSGEEQPEGMDAREPRPVRSAHCRALSTAAGGSDTGGQEAQSGVRYRRPDGPEFLAHQPGHSLRQGQESVPGSDVSDPLRSRAEKAGGRSALRRRVTGRSHRRVSHLRRAAERTSGRNYAAARRRKRLLACGAGEGTVKEVRKLVALT